MPVFKLWVMVTVRIKVSVSHCIVCIYKYHNYSNINIHISHKLTSGGQRMSRRGAENVLYALYH